MRARKLLPLLAVPLLLAACDSVSPTASLGSDGHLRSSTPPRNSGAADSAQSTERNGGLMFGSGT